MTKEEAITLLKKLRKFHNGTYAKAIDMAIEALSADRPTTDCTKFMEWLKAEVLDEENWELNAVANGEIICRKFRKLGWLDVEDGYYVDTRPTMDKEHLIDLIQEAVYDGEACAKLIDLVDRPTWIPMREKKPKRGQRVIYLYDAFGEGTMMTAESSNAMRVINDVAIAWMPFPPYKEDSDG